MTLEGWHRGIQDSTLLAGQAKTQGLVLDLDERAPETVCIFAGPDLLPVVALVTNSHIHQKPHLGPA
jgi:hypothetical protein